MGYHLPIKREDLELDSSKIQGVGKKVEHFNRYIRVGARGLTFNSIFCVDSPVRRDYLRKLILQKNCWNINVSSVEL
jgi:hypothetical protein